MFYNIFILKNNLNQFRVIESPARKRNFIYQNKGFSI